MGQERLFLTRNHVSTARDYQSRATGEKPQLATIAKRFDRDYWDGARTTGYGGYVDDGRWTSIAEKILASYILAPGASVLDVGCGKGFFLKALRELRPDLKLTGFDVSKYALAQAPDAIKPCLFLKGAQDLETVPDASFDLVVSMNTLHNLELRPLVQSLRDIERISKGWKWICVESWRTEEEKWNLMRWQLTCEAFHTPQSWGWIFEQSGYSGDWEYIYFS